MEATLELEAYGVRLETLAERHLPGIAAVGDDPDLWEFTFKPNPFGTPQAARSWFDAARSAPDMHTFAILDARTGEIAGSTRYLDITPQHRKLEIGWTFLGKRFWRTHVNTAAKFALLRYAFDEWGAVRVQLKAEAKNLRSHAAILRLGAVHEGTLRNYRIKPDGEMRDTAFYSIIAPEWPLVHARLTGFLRGGVRAG
jgi:RimJ/RimL family protein N-acetyltransferase